MCELNFSGLGNGLDAFTTKCAFSLPERRDTDLKKNMFTNQLSLKNSQMLAMFPYCQMLFHSNGNTIE